MKEVLKSPLLRDIIPSVFASDRDTMCSGQRHCRRRQSKYLESRLYRICLLGYPRSHLLALASTTLPFPAGDLVHAAGSGLAHLTSHVGRAGAARAAQRVREPLSGSAGWPLRNLTTKKAPRIVTVPRPG